MAQKRTYPTAAGVGKKFPAEAYEYEDDVSQEAVEHLRREVGTDFSGPEWEVVDGFGRVIHA